MPGAASPFRLRQAAQHLLRGGLVAYPTEAVFGLGCVPADGEAFSALLALKGRDVAKGVILVAADARMFLSWLAPLPHAVLERMHDTWPGPVTWVAPAADGVPEWLTGGRGTLAVRVPAHATARELSRLIGGPLVSTSANPAGRRPARTALGVRRYFDDEPLLTILGGSTAGRARPSTVRDALTGAVLRA